MDRIIFLDIEGVLLCNTSWYKNKQAFDDSIDFIREKIPSKILESISPYDIGAVLNFNSEAVDHLLSLCQIPNTKIVLSSSWRIKGMQLMKILFSLHGLDQYLIDMTPQLSFQRRADEIKAWLEFYPNPIEQFVILDDNDSGLSSLFPDQFVYTQDYLQLSDFKRAMSILKGKAKDSLHSTDI